MTAVRTCRVSGKASQFLKLLSDFGHVDEDMLQCVLTVAASGASTCLDQDEVRRAVARELFLRRAGEVSQGPLGEDWALLFS